MCSPLNPEDVSECALNSPAPKLEFHARFFNKLPEDKLGTFWPPITCKTLGSSIAPIPTTMRANNIERGPMGPLNRQRLKMRFLGCLVAFLVSRGTPCMESVFWLSSCILSLLRYALHRIVFRLSSCILKTPCIGSVFRLSSCILLSLSRYASHLRKLRSLPQQPRKFISVVEKPRLSSFLSRQALSQPLRSFILSIEKPRLSS